MLTFKFKKYTHRMQIDIKDIATLCKSIIQEPARNIKKIKILLNTETGDNSLKYLSILKIFKSIIPLYKIRLLKDKVKHKKEQDKVSKEDIAILKMYSYFINKICSEDTYCCYKIACEVLEHFDHFNYTDIIVKKILKGTLKENIVSDMCIETLRKKIFFDSDKNITFCIINQMYETNYKSDVLSLLINIKILDKEKIDEEKNNLKSKDKFFKTTRSLKKDNLKIEKLRRKKESDVRKDENLDKNQEEYIFHRKIIDGVQRLYFQILRKKIKQKFKYTFIGIRIYKEFIRKEFYEGLYILLNENLELCTYEDKLECILTILCIYSGYKYDFKKIVQALYNTLNPFFINNDILKKIEIIIDQLFFKTKQPQKRVHVILEKLILIGCINYSYIITNLIKNIESYYDIDFYEKFKFKDLENDNEQKDIDQEEIRPLFCYEIFSKML